MLLSGYNCTPVSYCITHCFSSCSVLRTSYSVTGLIPHTWPYNVQKSIVRSDKAPHSLRLLLLVGKKRYFCLCCRHFLLFCFTPASGQIYHQHTCYHHCIDHFLSHFFFASLCRLSQFPLISLPDFCTVHIPDKENAGSYGFCHTLPHFFHFYVLFLMLVFLMLLFQILSLFLLLFHFQLLSHLLQQFHSRSLLLHLLLLRHLQQPVHLHSLRHKYQAA